MLSHSTKDTDTNNSGRPQSTRAQEGRRSVDRNCSKFSQRPFYSVSLPYAGVHNQYSISYVSISLVHVRACVFVHGVSGIILSGSPAPDRFLEILQIPDGQATSIVAGR